MSSDLKNTAAVKPAAWLVGACLLAVYIVWGTTYFAIKVAIEGVAPFFLVGTRFVAAGVLLLGWQALRGFRRNCGADQCNAAGDRTLVRRLRRLAATH